LREAKVRIEGSNPSDHAFPQLFRGRLPFPFWTVFILNAASFSLTTRLGGRSPLGSLCGAADGCPLRDDTFVFNDPAWRAEWRAECFR
jgi:hypothetical protein